MFLYYTLEKECEKTEALIFHGGNSLGRKAEDVADEEECNEACLSDDKCLEVLFHLTKGVADCFLVYEVRGYIPLTPALLAALALPYPDGPEITGFASYKCILRMYYICNITSFLHS